MIRSTAVSLALAAAALLAAGPAAAGPTCKINPKGLTVCFGRYALCATSTCKQTADGKAECTCPVLDGPSVADPSQTNGTCSPTKPGGVYSFFSLEQMGGGLLTCPSGGHWAQCWNAPCELLPGGKEAKCVCPLCTGGFATPGGGCNTANCSSQILVGAPFPTKGNDTCHPPK